MKPLGCGVNRTLHSARKPPVTSSCLSQGPCSSLLTRQILTQWLGYSTLILAVMYIILGIYSYVVFFKYMRVSFCHIYRKKGFSTIFLFSYISLDFKISRVLFCFTIRFLCKLTYNGKYCTFHYYVSLDIKSSADLTFLNQLQSLWIYCMSVGMNSF